jgi:enoyl-CoA hydratase/carnithine racemase
MDFQNMLYDKKDGIARITLNQPDKRNPLSWATAREITSALDDAARDSDVRVVIITGTDPAFSGGGDLAEMTRFLTMTSLEHREEGNAVVLMFRAVWHIEKPVIAMVNGPALAGACGLVAACDLAIASEKAKFGATEINVGMFPMVMLPALYRAVGRKKALEMGLTGAIFDAHEAERIGLVNRVVPHEQLEETVMELANQIKARSTVPVRIGKTALNVMEDMDFDKALEYARHTNTIWFTSQDVKEGATAFTEKRKPVWQDK